MGSRPDAVSQRADDDREKLGARITPELSAPAGKLSRIFRLRSFSGGPVRARWNPQTAGKINHDVQIASLHEFIHAILGIDPAQSLGAPIGC